MATVPIYDAEKTLGAAKTVKVAKGQGQGISQKARQISAETLKFGLRIKQEQDETQAGDAYLDYSTRSRSKIEELRKMNTKDISALGKAKGKGDWGASEEFNAWSKKNLGEIVSERQLNPQQAQIFSENTRRLEDHNLNSMSTLDAVRHRESLNTLADGARLDGMSMVTMDPTQGAYDISVANINITALKAGKSDAQVRKMQADLAVARVIPLMEHDTVAARDFYDKNPQVFGAAGHDIDDKITAFEVKGAGEVAARGIVANHAGDYKAQLEALDGIEDSEVSAHARKLVKGRHTDLEKARKEQDQQVKEDYVSQLVEHKKAGGGLIGGLGIVHDTTGTLNVELEELAEKIFAPEEDTISTTAKTMGSADLSRRIDKGDFRSSEAFLLEAIPLVGAEEAAKLDAYRQDGGIAGKIKDTDVQRAFTLYTRTDPTKNESASKLYAQVRGFVEDQIISTGNTPNATELNKLVATALRGGESLGGGFFTAGYGHDSSYVKAKEAGTEATWLPNYGDLTPDELNSAETWLKSNNMSSTEFNIKYYYRTMILDLKETPELIRMYGVENKAESGVR